MLHSLLDDDLVHEGVRGELAGLVVEFVVANHETPVVHLSEVFASLLLLLNLLLKLPKVERESIDLALPLDQDLTLKLHAEAVLLAF